VQAGCTGSPVFGVRGVDAMAGKSRIGRGCGRHAGNRGENSTRKPRAVAPLATPQPQGDTKAFGIASVDIAVLISGRVEMAGQSSNTLAETTYLGDTASEIGAVALNTPALLGDGRIIVCSGKRAEDFPMTDDPVGRMLA
jgi:hypothetical protein